MSDIGPSLHDILHCTWTCAACTSMFDGGWAVLIRMIYVLVLILSRQESTRSVIT